MNQLSHEQFTAAQKASFDAMVGLTSKALEGLEKLCELNLQTMRVTLAEVTEGTRKASSAQDLQEVIALQLEMLQPMAGKALSYRRHLYEIATATKAEFDKVAEAQYEANKRGMQTFIEKAAGAAPANSGATFTAWQSVIEATNSLFESMQSTARQAVEVAERNLESAEDEAVKAVQHQVAQPSRAAK